MTAAHEYYRKPFDQESHNKHDSIARDAAIRVIRDCLKLKAVNNPNKYDIDIQIFNGNGTLVGVVECEIKNNWKYRDFPFPDMNFLPKKARAICEDYPDVDVLHFMFNADLTRVAITDRKIISKYRDSLKVQDNKFGKGEKFVSIPKKDLIIMDVPNE